MEGLIIFGLLMIVGMYYNARYGGAEWQNTAVNELLGNVNKDWKRVWIGSSIFIIVSLVLIYFLEP